MNTTSSLLVHSSSLVHCTLSETHLDVVRPCERWSTVCTKQQHWKPWQRGVDCEPCCPWGRGKWCRFKLWQPVWQQYHYHSIQQPALNLNSGSVLRHYCVQLHITPPERFKTPLQLFSHFRHYCYWTSNYITSELWIVHIWTGSYWERGQGRDLWIWTFWWYFEAHRLVRSHGYGWLHPARSLTTSLATRKVGFGYYGLPASVWAGS